MNSNLQFSITGILVTMAHSIVFVLQIWWVQVRSVLAVVLNWLANGRFVAPA